MAIIRQHHPLAGLGLSSLGLKSLLVALCVAVIPAALAGGDAVAGKVKAQTCTGCHAVESYQNVYPTYNVPKLGGQHADFIVSALTSYRSGGRPHATMQANAANLTDQDIQDIAAYFASVTGAE